MPPSCGLLSAPNALFVPSPASHTFSSDRPPPPFNRMPAPSTPGKVNPVREPGIRRASRNGIRKSPPQNAAELRCSSLPILQIRRQRFDPMVRRHQLLRIRSPDSSSPRSASRAAGIQGSPARNPIRLHPIKRQSDSSFVSYIARIIVENLDRSSGERPRASGCGTAHFGLSTYRHGIDMQRALYRNSTLYFGAMSEVLDEGFRGTRKQQW